MHNSGYGRIPIRAWMELEMLRINSNPNRQAEIRYKDDKMALFVDGGGGR